MLSHLFIVARNEWGFEELSNPATHITLPKLPSGRTRRLLDRELELILSNTESELLKPIRLIAVKRVEATFVVPDFVGI